MVVIETPLAPSSMMVSATADPGPGPDLPPMLPLLLMLLKPARLLNRDIGTLLLLLSCDASREKAPVLILDLERLRLRPRLSSIECAGSRGVVGGGGPCPCPWSTDRLVGREKLWWREWGRGLGRLSLREWLLRMLE